jgi:hypothetical protein
MIAAARLLGISCAILLPRSGHGARSDKMNEGSKVGIFFVFVEKPTAHCVEFERVTSHIFARLGEVSRLL